MSWGKCAAMYKLTRNIQTNVVLRKTFALEQALTALMGRLRLLYRTLSLSWLLDGVVGQKQTPASLNPGKETSY